MLLLRKVGLDRQSFASEEHGAHKIREIEDILATSEPARAVLFGDSSQLDAAAYAEIIDRHPDRIAAAYLRDVAGTEARARVRSIIQHRPDSSAPMIMERSSAGFEAHARLIGLLRAQS